jgi:hypothetical protein
MWFNFPSKTDERKVYRKIFGHGKNSCAKPMSDILNGTQLRIILKQFDHMRSFSTKLLLPPYHT